MPAIEIHGQNIHYDRYPADAHHGGSPLLLMHGWTQTSEDLRPLATRLAEVGYEVITPDLPGYGRSVPPQRTYPPDFYRRDARLMAAFVDAYRADKGTKAKQPIHIMGFSDGGEVALLLGIERPDLCRSVIAWGAIGAFGPEACEHSCAGLPPTWITDEIRAKHPGQDVDQWPYQWVDAFCAMIAVGGDISLSRAGQIACPLLLMLGSEDRLNPVATAQRFIEIATRNGQNGIPRALRTFEGAGHAIHEQQPESFEQVVLDFLKEAEDWHDRHAHHV